MAYTIRALLAVDLQSKSFFRTLSNLRPIEKLGLQVAEAIFADCEQRGIETYVAEEDGEIVGTIRLLFEPKYYHQGRLAAHIEDLATSAEHQGKGIGGSLINHALTRCKEKNCYRVTLACGEKLCLFYQHFGFNLEGRHFRLDF
jgi:GNAT superfamily N-acetyltransferase